jgi:CO dehydrogenase maturation factor
MSKTIAISGKGGTGKTTISAMMIRTLIEHATSGVLAVDADPNACLAMTLGAEVTSTVSDLREQAREKQPTNTGMDRTRTFELGLQQIITEEKGYDLLTMGQPEGPSCYCAANNLLRKYMNDLNNAYSYVLIDNEAGMEHLSRRTSNNIDLLLIVADATPIGKVTAQRITKLVKTLPIVIKRVGMVWNRTDAPLQVDGLENVATLPYDKEILEASADGATIFDLDKNNPAFSAVRNLLEKELNLNKVDQK